MTQEEAKRLAVKTYFDDDSFGQDFEVLAETVYNEAVSAIALECNKRIFSQELPEHLENSMYWKGYKEALSELVEWIEYDMEK